MGIIDCGMAQDKRVLADIARWRAHPALMVRELFGVEPDPWQAAVLEAFPHKDRIAMPAAKGVGKTTCLAWIGWNFLLTRPAPKCAATSISGDNLRDNFWTEMSKWQQRSPLLTRLFQWTNTRIFARDNPQEWWMSARTYAQSGDAAAQANTLAGLHADYILFLIDESGGMTDAVMVSADAALSSCMEGHIVQAGNPTSLSGPLYRAVHPSGEQVWHVVRITSDPDDPNRSPRMTVKWAREFIAQYGADSDWTRVSVMGLFPRSSFNALIGPDDMRAAFKRFYREYEYGSAARVLGVDVSRSGDDSSVIFPRQGSQAFEPIVLRGVDSIRGASTVNLKWREWDADAAFIDDTGGFGSGWIDQMRLLGRSPIGVHFNGKARESTKFANRRSEMYYLAAEWIKAGGALCEDRELLEDMTNTSYSTPKGILEIEPKALVKAKQLGRSPDKGDGFILTFAEPIIAKTRGGRKPVHSYDWVAFPDAPMDKPGAGEYDPWR